MILRSNGAAARRTTNASSGTSGQFLRSYTWVGERHLTVARTATHDAN